MRSTTVSCACRSATLVIAMMPAICQIMLEVRAQEPTAAGVEAAKHAKPNENREKPWRATGQVTDEAGRQIKGVDVWANCGSGTLRRTGIATTGADGRYELNFGPGVLFLRGHGVQAAIISAHKSGFYEQNLNRQGGCQAADEPPDDETLKTMRVPLDRLFLPNKPLEINFVMRPAGSVAGKLVDEQGAALVGYSVSLSGAELPPSSSVQASVNTDADGRFSIDNIPTNYRYQFIVSKANPKPPWDDSWASAAMRFDRSEKSNLRAWFGPKDIEVESLVIRVTGDGVHERTATQNARKLGTLNLTAVNPADIRQRSETRLVVRSAVLSLRNSSLPEKGQSLIEESVP